MGKGDWYVSLVIIAGRVPKFEGRYAEGPRTCMENVEMVLSVSTEMGRGKISLVKTTAREFAFQMVLYVTN